MAQFTLPPLPYAYEALEPYLDAETMRIHHDKHHATYVNNLNAALENYPDLQDKSLEHLLRHIDAVPLEIRTAVRNNAGGHHNHTLFWDIMTPGGAKSPTGELADALQSAFGGLESLQAHINELATKRFGSGWAWLVINIGGDLEVMSTADQNSPLLESMPPVLGIDVWEHAYYLKYQNRRPDYLNAWWNVVNWDRVGVHYQVAKSNNYSLEVALSTLAR